VIDVTGTVTMGDLVNGFMELAGGAFVSTILKARDLSGSIHTARLNLTARHLTGSLTAFDIRAARVESATDVRIVSDTGVRLFRAVGEFRGQIEANQIDVFRAGSVTAGSVLSATAITNGIVGLVEVAGDFN